MKFKVKSSPRLLEGRGKKLKVKNKQINLLDSVKVESAAKPPRGFYFKKHKIKDYIIPHAGNNHQPHLLNSKRAIFYSLFFILLKGIVFLTAASLPLQAFLMPDALAQQRSELLVLIGNIRQVRGLPYLAENNILDSSSQARADDMLENKYFSHNGPKEHDFKYFLQQAGYRYHFAGENLAMGFFNPEAVVNAWIKSPLHYKNIIDGDFSETGLGIVSGMYEGEETVLVAHHFGDPVVKTAIVKSEPEAVEMDEQEKTVESVLGDTTLTVEVVKPAQLDRDNSKVFWKYNGELSTFEPNAYITGEVAEASVYISGHQIKLEPDPEVNNLYSGKLEIREPIDDFFKVVIAPSIIIKGADGREIVESINWYEENLVSQTPVEKYQATKNYLPAGIAKLFTFSNIIYLIFAVIFATVLLFMIFIEIKKQHPHVIAQTLALLLLIVTLFII